MKTTKNVTKWVALTVLVGLPLFGLILAFGLLTPACAAIVTGVAVYGAGCE